MRLPRPCLATLLTILLAPGASAAAGSRHYFRIEIDKSEQRLQVLREHEVVREYRISHGQGGPGPKRRAGDHKTPEGDYLIHAINPESRFELFFLLDYPNPMDVWRALQSGQIGHRHYRRFQRARERRRLPPQHTLLGGWIGIHGLGFAPMLRRQRHRRTNWTEGCIALTNREIHDLRRYIKIGTPVTIRR